MTFTSMIPTYFMLSFELEYNLDVCMDIDCDFVPHLKNQLAIIKDVTTRHTLFDTSLHVYCDIVDNCFFSPHITNQHAPQTRRKKRNAVRNV